MARFNYSTNDLVISKLKIFAIENNLTASEIIDFSLLMFFSLADKNKDSFTFDDIDKFINNK